MSRSRRNLLVVPLFVASVAVVCVLVKNCAPSPTDAPVAASSASGVAGSASGGTASASTGGPPSDRPPGIVGPVPLLDGLRTGDAVGEWTVTRMIVNQSEDGKPQLAIELERKGSGITVWVAKLVNAKNQAASTAKYGLTYGHARAYGDPIPEDAYVTTMNAIAERVRRSEATAPPPAGL